METTVDEFRTHRRLHPAIGRKDPECRNEGPHRHHDGSEQVNSLWHLVASEQQHAEEGRLEEEGRDHLVAEQGSKEVRGSKGEVAPVGAELEGHDDARHHTHREDHRKDLGQNMARRSQAGLPVR
ncbi:hypothetical protein A8U91_00904 [Halomonas elongata]|uniref:Uncharacterized protein n=1 Tax=Halomonas elongata TaxID=2746 RepID=A0A1B8P2S5_HALEL|nr:hypothetical protein A8U91_00904 [Halomonas elongata]